MSVIKLSEKDFVEAVTREESVVVLEFYAEWCKPCHKISPIIEELSEEFSGISFYKIDSDEEILLASAFKAYTLPTVVFARAGVVKDVAEGCVSKERVVEGINKLLFEE